MPLSWHTFLSISWTQRYLRFSPEVQVYWAPWFHVSFLLRIYISHTMACTHLLLFMVSPSHCSRVFSLHHSWRELTHCCNNHNIWKPVLFPSYRCSPVAWLLSSLAHLIRSTSKTKLSAQEWLGDEQHPIQSILGQWFSTCRSQLFGDCTSDISITIHNRSTVMR